MYTISLLYNSQYRGSNRDFFKAVHIFGRWLEQNGFSRSALSGLARRVNPCTRCACVFTLEFSDYVRRGNLEQTMNSDAIAAKLNSRSVVVSVHGNSCERSNKGSISICNISVALAAQQRPALWEFPADIS